MAFRSFTPQESASTGISVAPPPARLDTLRTINQIRLWGLFKIALNIWSENEGWKLVLIFFLLLLFTVATETFRLMRDDIDPVDRAQAKSI